MGVGAKREERRKDRRTMCGEDEMNICSGTNDLRMSDQGKQSSRSSEQSERRRLDDDGTRTIIPPSSSSSSWTQLQPPPVRLLTVVRL